MVGGAFFYWLFTLLSLCLMVKYMICQIAIILDRDAGHKLMMAFKGIFFTVFATVGFACWWGITGASYDADCEWEDRWEDIADGDAP